MTQADVTVLMAVYNAMPHLPAAVESIRAQTYRDWDMVIVNDGSTDDSPAYLAGLNDSRIRVAHQANQGLGAALNYGLAQIKTEFTARMDGDDIAHNTRLAEQIAFLRRHPEVGLVGAQIERMGTRRTASQSDCAIDHATIYADLLNGCNQMYHPTIVCRTELLKQVGGYWPHRWGEEWDLFLRMGEVSNLANLDRVLLSYRVHSGSMTGSSVVNMRNWVEYACLCARCRQEQREPPSMDEFVAQQQNAPLRRRASRRLQIHARNQYRIAVAEMLGDRPLVGSLRLAYSTLWSPSLTIARMGRIGRRWLRPVAESDTPQPCYRARGSRASTPEYQQAPTQGK
jgi:hypothetical protein